MYLSENSRQETANREPGFANRSEETTNRQKNHQKVSNSCCMTILFTANPCQRAYLNNEFIHIRAIP